MEFQIGEIGKPWKTVSKENFEHFLKSICDDEHPFEFLMNKILEGWTIKHGNTCVGFRIFPNDEYLNLNI